MRYSTVSGGSEADFRVDFWAAASFIAAAADVDMMMGSDGDGLKMLELELLIVRRWPVGSSVVFSIQQVMLMAPKWNDVHFDQVLMNTSGVSEGVNNS